MVKDFDNKVYLFDVDFGERIGPLQDLMQIPLGGFDFSVGADFSKSKFPWVDFRKSRFGFQSLFDNAIFQKRCDFSGSVFDFGVVFRNASFLSIASFSDCRFDAFVDFSVDLDKASTCSFSGLDFSGSIFLGDVDFTGRKFLGPTNFSNVVFNRPPKFHHCEIHQDTTFAGAKFPPATGSEDAVRAYRTLKLAFSKQQAIREEQHFFRLEMAEEALRESGVKRFLFWMYRVFSDYGFSVTRPLIFWMVGVCFLTIAYGLLSWLG